VDGRYYLLDEDGWLGAIRTGERTEALGAWPVAEDADVDFFVSIVTLISVELSGSEPPVSPSTKRNKLDACCHDDVVFDGVVRRRVSSKGGRTRASDYESSVNPAKAEA